MRALPDGWPRISPTLSYADARGAIDWLCRAFDFELRLLVETGDGAVAHSELVYGDGVIMVAQAGPQAAGPAAVKGSHSVMVYVDDVEAHCKKARENGATITTELKVSDYGPEYWTDRSYGATDCGGHSWWFTQRIATGNPNWSKVRQKRDLSHREQG